MRTRKSDLTAVQNRINDQLERLNADFRITVEWSYGQPRAYKTYPPETYVSNLSPRLPMAQMYDWLCAYSYGLDVVYHIRQERQA